MEKNTIEKRFNNLECLVPDEGAAATIEGEIIRAVQRVLFRYFNDGDEYDIGYGLETVSPSVDWLIARSPIFKSVSELFPNIGDYEKTLKKLQEIAVIYVESKNGHYQSNSNEDSRFFQLPYKKYKEEWYDELYDDQWDYDEWGERRW